MSLPANAGEYLLPLARAAIEARLAGTKTAQIPIQDLQHSNHRPTWLDADGASFVTLSLGDRLRGCIGSLEPHRALSEDVAHNAIAAAFHDPRFAPLSESEMAHLWIEVSVLSPRVPLEHSSEDDVRMKVRPGIDGVVLEAGPFNRATYLPQVWEQLPDPREFIESLKRKAGLPETWWSDQAKVETYTVESWTEPRRY